MSASTLLPLESITHRNLLLREQKVLLDADLATLCGVETKVLLQAVRRNLERFPDDFMFQLTNQEFNVLRSQSVTSSSEALETLRWGGRRTAPYAFTEQGQGVAMLSSILSSSQAVQVNIAIMRAFVKLRELAMTHHDLAKQLTGIAIMHTLNETRYSRFPLSNFPPHTGERANESLRSALVRCTGRENRRYGDAARTFARNTRAQLKQVFDAIRELMTPPEPQKKRPIGFISGDEKPKKN